MRVFVTGASGFVGGAVVPELIAAGHEVEGLARSDASAAALAALGAAVRRGDLDDLEGIRAGAAAADGVIHLANKHDFARPAESNRAERAAVETIGQTLAGSDRPFVFASGTVFTGVGRAIEETDRNPAVGPDSPRGGSENHGLSYAQRGVRVTAARFAPTVHGKGDHGFVALIAEAARRTGRVLYPGAGENVWPAVHRLDTARLVRLALEGAPAGSIVHAVAEQGVPVRRIADAVGERLGLPVESALAEQVAAELPFVGAFLAFDAPASSERTRELLGWEPTGPTLLEDIAAGHYDR